MADLEGLGQRVRAARLAANLRQQDVADRAGLSRTSVTNIEADRQGDISVSTLVALANATDTTAGALLGEQPLPQSAVEHGFVLSADEKRSRGWYLAWRCRRIDCDARGNLTVHAREKAMELFATLDKGHREGVDA